MSSILTEHEAKKLISKYGIAVTKESIAENANEAFAIASQIGTPVAMKISSPDISHKSDVGGVMLNVSADGARSTYDRIIKQIKAVSPDARIEGVLVQQMVPPGHEVIIGLKKDDQFGHALMFGLGGIFVEVYKDVSFRVVPIGKREAHEMISEIKGYPVLKGIRGRKPANIEAIAQVLMSVSDMAEKERIIELDINPLIVNERKRIAALARKSRLPVIYDDRDFVEAGGLMSYGANLIDLYRRAAPYVDKILKGRKPADLPVEQPTRFEMVINLKAAKQIGLTIPPNVLARADKVIK